MSFQILKKDKDSDARLGLLKTSRGSIETPFFMPVGTNATVKGISNDELLDMESQIVLSNTYHLYLRPGMDVIEELGGLHAFMAWDKPILTDSGGYQVFSLSKFRKIIDEGVTFQSHLDGSSHLFTPERVVDIQGQLGSDMMMPLDECAPYPCEEEEAEESVRRTTLWAQRSKDHFCKSQDNGKTQKLFGIIQGATYRHLRERSAAEILKIGFDGYAIGGVSVGEPVPLMFETIQWLKSDLPVTHPRYMMGIGLPDQIVRAVGEGIDMFDTCIPTRFGRHGTALTAQGRMIIRNAEFARDQRPLDETCGCAVCQKYTRSYLRHLCTTGELLGMRFISYHNVYFYNQLLKQIRTALKGNHFQEFQKKFLDTYNSDLTEGASHAQN